MAWLPALGLAGLLSGCGASQSQTLDPVKVEQAIAASIQSQRGVVASVTCPSGQPLAAHHQFHCVAQVKTQITPFLVTETDGSGHVSFVGTNPSATSLINSAAVARAITRSIATRHVSATVACPSDIPQQQGLSFVCTARTASGTVTRFQVRQTDDHGHVSYGAV